MISNHINIFVIVRVVERINGRGSFFKLGTWDNFSWIWLLSDETGKIIPFSRYIG